MLLVSLPRNTEREREQAFLIGQVADSLHAASVVVYSVVYARHTIVHCAAERHSTLIKYNRATATMRVEICTSCTDSVVLWMTLSVLSNAIETNWLKWQLLPMNGTVETMEYHCCLWIYTTYIHIFSVVLLDEQCVLY